MLSILFRLIFLNWQILIINCQYQTASYQRPQNRFGSDIINYRITTTLRTTTVKQDPDSFFFGFFPIWSAILTGLTAFCLLISLVGLICYFIGCVNPWKALKKESCVNKQQKFFTNHQCDDQFYDDISMRMLDTIDKDNPSLFNDSKLVSEYEMDPKLKKKIFRREHL